MVAGVTVTVGGGGAVRVGAGPDGGDDPEPPQASAKSTKNTTPIVSVDLIAAGMGIFTLESWPETGAVPPRGYTPGNQG